MKKFIIASLVLAPAFVLAQEPALGNLEAIVSGIGRIVGIALPIVLALGLLAFFWGLVKFIFSQGNEEVKVEAKKIMLWGLVALFVMVAVWGIVIFIGDALGIEQGQTIVVPAVPGV
jgi:hypothetical protein